MSHIAMFTILLGAVCLAMGADSLYPASPPLNDEEVKHFLDSDTAEHFVPDIEHRYDPFLPVDDVPSVSSKRSNSIFSRKSTLGCKKSPEIVELFASNFIGRIKLHEKLLKAYHQIDQFTADSIRSFFYKYVLEIHASIKAPDAEVSAQIVSTAAALNFHKVKKDSLLEILAYAAAENLFYRGLLNPNNVDSFSQQYFQLAEERINSVPNPTPQANVGACSLAFIGFLTSRELFNQYSTVMVAGGFASLWYAL